MAAIIAWVLRVFGPMAEKILAIFAPQIIAGIFNLLKDAVFFVVDKVKTYFKKQERESEEKKLLENEKNAKTDQDQEKAFTDIINHNNGN